MTPSMGQRVRPAALWSLTEVVVRQAVLLGATVLLARLLTPDSFGAVAMVLVFTVLGTTIAEAGLGSALVQRSAVDRHDETTAFAASLALACVAAMLLIASREWIVGFYGEPALAQILPVMALSLPLSALGTVPDALLTRTLEFRKRAAAEAIASTISAIITIALALRGLGIWSLAWQPVLSAGLRSTLLLAYAGWRPKGRFSTASLLGLWRFGGYLLAANLLDAAYTRLQALILGRLAGTGELGQYNLAQNVQQAPTNLASTVLNRIGLAAFSPLAADRSRLKEAMRRTLAASMFAFAPAMLGLSLLSWFLVPLIFGEAWRPASKLLSVLALAAIPWPWHVLNLVALNAMGHSRLVLRIEIWKKTVAAALILGAGPFGAVAIAWAVVAGSILSLAFNALYVARLLDYGLLRQSRDLMPTFAACAAASAAATATYWLMGADGAALGLACVVYAAGYVGLCIATRQAGPRECLQIAFAWREALAPAASRNSE